MLDQEFGTKELYLVVLRAHDPFYFGDRYIEADEPVLYFENITMSMLTEKSSPIAARGGWANMPRVIWEDRSEVLFTMYEGVMSNTSMGILMSANVTTPTSEDPYLAYRREGPYELDDDGRVFLDNWPVELEKKKTFIFEYDRSMMQKKVYGKRIHGIPDPFLSDRERPCIELYEDKELKVKADTSKSYVVDYYYEYGDLALIYTLNKERLNNLFSLEGKFYSKDENEGLNYTNIIYMPRIRVVSDINLRLGERADPTVSTFNIIGMPEKGSGARMSRIMEITRLNGDIDGEI